MTERRYPVEPRAPAVLTVDVGGSNVKAVLNGVDERRRFPSGKKLTAEQMVTRVLELTADWTYVGVSVGIPAPVVNDRVLRDPVNLGKGWKGFDLAEAFGKPTKVLNDAAMQALGSYQGGRMLFLGLGTGLGSTMILDGTIAPMEIGHLPFRKATYEDYVGERGARAPRSEPLAEGSVRHRRAAVHRAAAGLRRPRRRQRRAPEEAAAELQDRAQRGRVPRRLSPLGRSGVAERGERRAGLALDVRKLLGREVASPATGGRIVRLREDL